MEVFIFGWWWRSHQSLAHKGSRIVRFCIMLWKGEREPTIKLCMGRQMDVVQKFTGIQSFGQNWWWTNGIRVEYLPRIHHIAACPWSPHWAYNQKISLDGLSSCRCSTTSHGDLKTTKKNANQALNSFLSMRKDFHQDSGHSSDLDQKRNGILLTNTNHKENGTELQSMMITFVESRHPVFRSIIQRSAHEQWWWKIVNTLLCRWRDGWNCFSHNYFCYSAQYLRSSLRFVWRICILSRSERWDPLWKDNLIHCSCQVW